MKFYKRHAQKLIKQAEIGFKAMLLTGARQTGKTTLLENMYDERPLLTFDDDFLVQQAKENPGEFLDLNEPPIIFDEIQYVPELFRYLKMQCDSRKKNGMYFLTGSQPFKLMDLASDSMAGRIAVIELPTLSLREITDDAFDLPFVPGADYVKSRKKTAKKPGNIWKIIHTGGYPGVQPEKVNTQMFFASYVKTYLERDVRALASVHDLDRFRRFMVACAARTGQVVNYTNISRELEISAETVKNWMSVLEASGIIFLLEPFSHSVLTRAIKTPKLYFRDTGLASYLTRWLTHDTLANGAMSGAMFETFVVSEILKSFSNAGYDYRYCVTYYRNKDRANDKEIDLIIEQNGTLYPVEIKKKEHPSDRDVSAFNALDKIPDKEKGTGAVICMCPAPGMIGKNVLALPVWYV